MTKGQKFYDEYNGRYLTVDRAGINPHVYECIVEEIDYETEELKVVGSQLFYEYELNDFEEV